MEFKRFFAYLMILTGIILEFFSFQLCSKTMCYFFKECDNKLSVECISAYLMASILLVIGGLYILSKCKNHKYT